MVVLMVLLSFIVLAAASPPCNGWHAAQLDRMMLLISMNRIEKK